MVTIAQKAFNEDMDRYIRNLRKSDSGSTKKFSWLKANSSERVPELFEDEVHVEYREPSFWRKIFAWRRRQKMDELDDVPEDQKAKLEELEGEIEAIEDEESQIEDMEEDLERRRQGLLKTFFSRLGFFGGSRRIYFEEEYDVPEENLKPQFDEDVKEVLKITHGWLEKLPIRQKKAFKESEDFEKYKEILLKYGLVKEKE